MRDFYFLTHSTSSFKYSYIHNGALIILVSTVVCSALHKRSRHYLSTSLWILVATNHSSAEPWIRYHSCEVRRSDDICQPSLRTLFGPETARCGAARVEFDRARAGYHQPVLGPYIQVCCSVVGGVRVGTWTWFRKHGLHLIVILVTTLVTPRYLDVSCS
jgi:hypothetical protein